jgi:hypothetical protein
MVATTIIDSFLPQASPTATPTIDAAATYLFMARQQNRDVLEMPLNTEIQQAQPMGQYYADLTAGNQIANGIVVSGHPVNCIPFWALLGKADLAGGNYVEDSQRDISNLTLTEGVKPTYACHEVVGDTKHTVYGVLFNQLDLSMRNDGNPLLARMSGIGQSQVSGDTPSGSTYPTSVSTLYDTMTHFKWNTTAYDVTDVAMTLMQVSRNSVGSTGFNVHNSDNSAILGNFTIGFIGDADAIWTDNFNKQSRAIEWKVDKSADASFFTVAAAGCFCHTFKYVKIGGEVVGGSAGFITTNVSVNAKDGIVDEFYKLVGW